MTTEQALTAANIRYLLVIRELDAHQRGARGSDIAQQLGVTKPSVFAMTRNLRELGLIEKEKYGTVFLTERGRIKAERYAACYSLILERLERSLGCAGADYRNAACELLADTPEGDLPLLRIRLQQNHF
jgi:Mn-dependent transcriptional regulator